MKKSLTLLALLAFTACQKPDLIRDNEPDQSNHLIGNTLFRWKLSEYSGPDTNGKLLKADSIAALKDDGIVFKYVENFPNAGYYQGTIYQGPLKYWPTKPDLTFPVTYLNEKTFKLGDNNGFNLATYDGEGETLTIIEDYPVKGRYYKYVKTSD